MTRGTPSRAGSRRPGAGAAALGLSVLAAAGWWALGEARGGRGVVAGDEGTFLAMTASLAEDGDLVFDERDRVRAEEAPPGGRKTVILQANGDRLAYSKPALYPMAAAPLYRLFDESGPPVLHGLVLVAALVLAWSALRRVGDGGGSALTLVTFTGASVLPAYACWLMSDGFQAALVLAGLALALGSLRPATGGRRLDRLLDGGAAAWIAGALLGAVVAQRLPNLLVLAGAVTALLLAGQRRRALRVLLGAIAVLALAGLLGHRLQGAANPYRAVRASFDGTLGYPVSAAEPLARERFATGLATQRLGWLPEPQPALSAYSALYTLIGRHTGLLAYFPALLAFAVPLARSRERARWALLAAAAATALFYVVWWPENYFGGSTFLGNRYFLTAYPLVLFALPALPGWRSIAAAWLLAGGLFASAWVSVLRTVEIGDGWQSQSHAYAGLFRLLPFESTAARIDGVRDLHWYGDVVRLIDPFAELRRPQPRFYGPNKLIWVGRNWPAELIVFTRPEVQSILFREAEHSVLEVPLARCWRRHPFPGVPGRPAAASSVRLRPGARPLAYGGDAVLRRGAFVRDYVKIDLPERVSAGIRSRVSVPVEVRNMSPYPWFAEPPFAVRLGYRMTRLPEGSQQPILGTQAIPGKIESGDLLTMLLDVPLASARPGIYRLEIDLRMDSFGSFAERVGEPLAEGRVEVSAPSAE